MAVWGGIKYQINREDELPQMCFRLHDTYHTAALLSCTGGGLGWMIGAINDVLSWRWTFRILGIVGLSLVPLAALALWEPKEVKRKRKLRQKGKASYTIKVS